MIEGELPCPADGSSQALAGCLWEGQFPTSVQIAQVVTICRARMRTSEPPHERRHAIMRPPRGSFRGIGKCGMRLHIERCNIICESLSHAG